MDSRPQRRMGWSFPWASSFDSDFNYDFQVSHTNEQQQSGALKYNYRATDFRPSLEAGKKDGFLKEIAFVLENGIVYHTYSAYSRGLDGLWGMYQWLDRAPKGRNEEEEGMWWRRHDEYLTLPQKASSCCHAEQHG